MLESIVRLIPWGVATVALCFAVLRTDQMSFNKANIDSLSNSFKNIDREVRELKEKLSVYSYAEHENNVEIQKRLRNNEHMILIELNRIIKLEEKAGLNSDRTDIPSLRKEGDDNADGPKDDIQQEPLNRESEEEDGFVLHRSSEDAWSQ